MDKRKQEEQRGRSLEDGKGMCLKSTRGISAPAVKVFFSQWVSPFSSYVFGLKAKLLTSWIQLLTLYTVAEQRM